MVMGPSDATISADSFEIRPFMEHQFLPMHMGAQKAAFEFQILMDTLKHLRLMYESRTLQIIRIKLMSTCRI
jgi:hypothetical protein